MRCTCILPHKRAQVWLQWNEDKLRGNKYRTCLGRSAPYSYVKNEGAEFPPRQWTREAHVIFLPLLFKGVQSMELQDKSPDTDEEMYVFNKCNSPYGLAMITIRKHSAKMP